MLEKSDLRLATTVSIPKSVPATIRLDQPYDKIFVERNCEQKTLSIDQPYDLKPNHFVLAQTIEKVAFPLTGDGPFYAARVEGKSSLARHGLLVHFTAPTIHTGFAGPITLEMINLGHNNILLTPGIYICQLIISELFVPTVRRNCRFDLRWNRPLSLK